MIGCNYCLFKIMKEKADREGKVVKLLNSSITMGSFEVFIVPRGTKLNQIKKWCKPSEKLPNGDENWQKYHKAWMMEISKKCCCGD